MQALGWQARRAGVNVPGRAGSRIERSAARKATAAVVGLGLLAGAVVWASRNESTTAVLGTTGATWLSGEGKGRIVFVAAGAKRPSFAVAIGDTDGTASAAYDIADLGADVLIQDRASGAIITLDGASGVERFRFNGAIPNDERAALTTAGSAAYLVDVAGQSAKRIDLSGEQSPSIPVGRGFTDWVGTTDGTLWMLNRSDGLSARFDGTTVKHTRFTRPNADLALTAVGNDPVVLDRDTLRLRWLRQSTSQDVPTTPRDAVAGSGGTEFGIDGAQVVLQSPDPSADCVALVTPSSLSCMSAKGLRRFTPLSEAGFATLPDLTGSRLFASPTDAVIVWPNRSDVAVLSWATGDVQIVSRGTPSSRPAVGWSGAGALIVDDPASRNALVVSDGQVSQLDKFSRGLIVISPTGVLTDLGFSSEGGDDELSAVGERSPTAAPATDDDSQPDAPIANPDRVVTRSGRSIVINALANDTDADGDPISITKAGPVAAADGSVAVVDASAISYRAPNLTNDRTITFPYTIADSFNLEAVGNVSVEVIGSGRNTSPTALDDDASTTAGQSVDINVLGNDYDDEGDPLTVNGLSKPKDGTAAIGEGGVIRYEPRQGFTGRDTFEYTIIDAFGGQRSADVRVEVTPARSTNQAPTANNDRVATRSGTEVRVEVLANDDDPDGDPIRVIDVARVSGVEATIVNGASISLTPGADLAGLLEIAYTIADTDGLTDSATIEVVVTAADDADTNSPPIATDDVGSSTGNPVIIDVVANDSDPAGGDLAVTAVTAPNPGTGVASRAGPRTVVFSPAVGFVGSTRFSYTVTNVAGRTATAAVIVQVSAPTGSGPVALDDSVTVLVGEPATVNVLANDTHPDGLAFDIVGRPVVRGGTAVVNSDDSITFTPPDSVPGVHTLTYTIQDSNGLRSSANVFITVVPRPAVNRAPTPADDLVSTGFETPTFIDVLSNDSDPDGGVLTLQSTSTPTNGTATVVGNRVRYTPDSSYFGLARFTYTVTDQQGLTGTAAVVVQVLDRIKIAPIATDDLVTIVAGTTLSVNPLSNDLDPDGTASALAIQQVGSVTPLNGPTVLIVGDRLRVSAGTTLGRFDVAYTAVDPDGLSAAAVITILVQQPPNQPPNAVDDLVTILSLPTTINVLSNDSDPDGGTLSIDSVGGISPLSAGSAELLPSGTAIEITPAPGFSGEMTVRYTIRDDRNAVSSARIVATVSACPALPSLAAVFATTRFETAVEFNLFGGEIPNGVLSLGPASTGSAALNPTTGTVRYTPAAGYNGIATFTYSVRTICNATATATASVTVNRAPTAVADSFATPDNRVLSLNVLGNDSDPDLDTLRLVSISNASGGQATALASDIVEFQPSAGFKGTASFDYTIADVGGLQDTGTATIVVSNAPPTAVPDATTTESLIAAVSRDVIANDVDPNGDVLSLLSIDSISPSGLGTALRSGNSIVFTPDPGVGPGVVTIRYTVTDQDASASGELTITIVNRAPITGDDTGSIDTAAETSVTINVLGNDVDPDGPTSGLSVTSATVLASQGSVVPSGSSVTFTPAPGASGSTVLISYIVTDLYGAQSQGSLTITVL